MLVTATAFFPTLKHAGDSHTSELAWCVGALLLLLAGGRALGVHGVQYKSIMAAKVEASQQVQVRHGR